MAKNNQVQRTRLKLGCSAEVSQVECRLEVQEGILLTSGVSERVSKMEEVLLRLSEAELSSAKLEADKLGYEDVAGYFLELHRRNLAERSEYQSPPDRSSTTEVDHASYSVPPRRELKTEHGTIYCGDSSELMQSILEPESVDLVMTSPPFGLVRKKDYGNEDADRYLSWFEKFAEGFARVLKPSGSLVIDIGGAWKKGLPTRSLWQVRAISL